MLERLAGNTALKKDLTAALQGGRLPHAILLVGEKGCGTGFVARCLAADYLYPDGGPHAEAVLTGEDSECIVVRGEGASGLIKVGDKNNPDKGSVRYARREIQKSALATDAAGRVMFIYGAQNFNDASANALLKIIEEPPAGALFLLTATSAATVLPTIRSRCAAYTVAPTAPETCAAALQSRGATKNRTLAEELSFLYEGHIGTCLRVLGNADSKQALAAAKQLCTHAAKGDTYLALALLTHYEKDKAGLKELLWQLDQVCSAVLRRPAYGAALANFTPEKAARALRTSAAAQRKMTGNANQRLLLALLAGAITR